MYVSEDSEMRKCADEADDDKCYQGRVERTNGLLQEPKDSKHEAI